MRPDNTLIIENKADLENSRTMSDFLPDYPHLRLSLHQDTSLGPLRQRWLELIESNLDFPQTSGVIVNTRHAAALSEAVECHELALEKLRNGDLSELIAADLRDAVEAIGKVVGKVDNERMLDSLFQQFCIGK